MDNNPLVFGLILWNGLTEGVEVGIFGDVIIITRDFDASSGDASFFKKAGYGSGSGGRKLPVGGILSVGYFAVGGVPFDTEVKLGVAVRLEGGGNPF